MLKEPFHKFHPDSSATKMERKTLVPGVDIILTSIEAEILRLVTEGLTNREIATQLGYSEKHIEHILSSGEDSRALYPKLGVRDRVQAAVWYVRHLEK